MKYVYLNVNNSGKREGDCVTRAITLASKLPYDKVSNDLQLVSQLFNCEKLCVCCYQHLLDYVYKYKKILDYNGYTIEQFGNEHPLGTYIIRVNQHLTTIIDNTLYDIWDCRKEIVDIVWEIDYYNNA